MPKTGTRKRKNQIYLSRQILENGGQVDGCTRPHSLSIVTLPQQPATAYQGHDYREKILYKSVLRIRDVYPGHNFFHPGSASKNLGNLTQKMVLNSPNYDPGCSSRIRIPDPDFLPIPDPGAKKAADPGSASATLKNRHL
jgi:hypothetical protein